MSTKNMLDQKHCLLRPINFSTDLMRRAAVKILKVFRRLLVSLRNTFNNKSPIRMRIGHLMFFNEHARSAHAYLENAETQF
jgi:hypothetical protein